MKRSLLFGWFILSIPFTCMSAIYTVGISAEDFPLVTQHQSNWCWAASVQMIAQYNQLNVSQEAIVERTFGRRFNGALPNYTGSVKNMSDNLNNWGVSFANRTIRISSTYFVRPPTSDELIEYLSREQPIILSYRSSVFSLHAVVIINCKYLYENGQKKVVEFTVADPWPTADNNYQAGFKTYNFSKFYDLMNDFFLLNVTKDGQTYISNSDLLTCKSTFCKTLSQYIKGLKNEFIDVRGPLVNGSKTTYENGLALPGQISNLAFTNGRFPSAFFSFYRGSDVNEARRVFDFIKNEMAELGKVEEIRIEYNGSKRDETKFEYVVDYINEIRIKWVQQENAHRVGISIHHKLKAGDF